jgi:hypothetical protein
MKSISSLVRRLFDRAECCRLSSEMEKHRPIKPGLQVRLLRSDAVPCPIADLRGP